MLARIHTATLIGVHGHAVDVEVHVANGLPGFTMLGLPDESCRNVDAVGPTADHHPLEHQCSPTRCGASMDAPA